MVKALLKSISIATAAVVAFVTNTKDWIQLYLA